MTDLVSVSATNHYKTLLPVVVNTSTGGASGWFGICSPVLDALMTSSTTGMSISWYWEGRVQLPYELYEFMVRFFKGSKRCLTVDCRFFALLMPV